MDQTRDIAGHMLARLSKMVEFPEYVKAASAEDVTGGHVFADGARRSYPCGSRSSTWLSSAFYLLTTPKSFDKLAADQTWSTLRKAGEDLGISDDLRHLFDKAASMSGGDDTLKDDDYALNSNDPRTGVQTKKYKLRNPKEVKKSVGYLVKWRGKFPRETRQKMAKAILRKADKFNVDIGPDREVLRKIAGDGFCTGEGAVDALCERIRALKRRNVELEKLGYLAQLAENIVKNPHHAYDNVFLNKVANVIDAIDIEYDIPREKVGWIEDSLFALSDASCKAACDDFIGSACGSVYAIEDLRHIRPDYAEAHLGTEFVKKAGDGLFLRPAKIAELLPTLSYDDAALFDQVAELCGVVKVASFPVSRPKLSMDDLRELANLS